LTRYSKVKWAGLRSSLWRDVFLFLVLKSLNLVHDRQVAVGSGLSWLLLLWEPILSLEVMLNKGASPVFEAFFLVAEFLVHDVIFEGRLLQRDLLANRLHHCAWDLPLFVGVVDFENLLGCWSPLILSGLLNVILNL
jgi:hypothetical protein